MGMGDYGTSRTVFVTVVLFVCFFFVLIDRSALVTGMGNRFFFILFSDSPIPKKSLIVCSILGMRDDNFVAGLP